MTRLPSLGPRGEGWVVLQLVLLSLVALSGVVAGDAWGGSLSTITSGAGLLLMLAGALLAGTGLLQLGPNLTPTPRPRDGARLVESGVYARVRHPIYGGIILAAFGWGLAAASPLTLLLAAVLSGFFELKSRREETWLTDHYRGYVEYMAHTRRFLPGLY